MKEVSISLDEQLSPHWKKFFNSFNDIDIIPIKEWKVSHLIGYFAKKYEQHYKISYTFAFTGPPSKSSEIKLMGRLVNMLTKDPVILKDYIDWYFEKEIVNRKRKINSIAALAQIQPINNFKLKKLLANNEGSVDRSTKIPSNYLEVLIKHNMNFSTYGELAFAKKSKNEKYNNIFAELKLLGMDISVLDKVK